MTTKDLLQLLQNARGDLIPKRCTQEYLQRNQLLCVLDELITSNFGTVGDRIKHLKYGGGYCLVCNVRTNVDSSGRGFAKYCSNHFHEPKKAKQAHNAKEVDMELAYKLYVEDHKSIIQISKQLGNVSNVTLKKKMVEAGIVLRSHAANQKLYSKCGPVGPKITIDRTELVNLYTKDKIPIGILANQYNCSQETIRRFLIQENVDRTNRRSVIEWMIIDILNRHNIPYRTNVKNIIAPFELDIYIDQHNLAIEINGLYTHSLHTGKKDKTYHYNKFISCKQKGIRLLQLWEDDVHSKIKIIESMLIHRLHVSTNHIDARKCNVSQLKFNVAAEFYDANHIQGSPANNTKSLGLFYGGQLVAAIGYLQLKGQTTIIRYCCARSFNVRGGFTKLISRLSRPLITYSSNDIGWGDLYSGSGFVQTGYTKYDLWYTNYQHIFNRQMFMKHKLASHPQISSFDANKTEIENMLANGFDVIYKSGTVTWKLDDINST